MSGLLGLQKSKHHKHKQGQIQLMPSMVNNLEK